MNSGGMAYLPQHASEEVRGGVASERWVLEACNVVYATLLLSGGLIGDTYVRGRAFAIGAVVMALAGLVGRLGSRLGPQGPASRTVHI